MAEADMAAVLQCHHHSTISATSGILEGRAATAQGLEMKSRSNCSLPFAQKCTLPGVVL